MSLAQTQNSIQSSFLFQNSYISALIIFICFLLIAFAVKFILSNWIRKIAEKTKTKADDLILSITTLPIFLGIILLGLYFALLSLSVLSDYILWVKGAFFVLGAFIVALVFARVTDVWVNNWLKAQKRFEKTPILVNKVINATIYLLAFLLVLRYFEIEVTPLLAGLGLGALAVGLALQGTLSNFFAGLRILSDKPINVGDYIEIENGPSGYVKDIGWSSTRIKTLPNTVVIVPNSKLVDSVVVNDSLPQQEMSIVLQCGVSYDSDLKKVERVTVDVAKKIQKTVPGAVKEFEPFIRFHTFADSNINFSIILRVEKFVDKYLVTHEFMKMLKERFDKEGIEISWPIRKIYYGEEKEKKKGIRKNEK